MTVQLKAGDKVRVLNSNQWGHCFNVDDEIQFIGMAGEDTYEFKGTSKLFGTCVQQVLHPSEFEVIKQPQKETQVSKQVEETGVTKEQGKLLYVVTNTAHNGVIASTHDRDLAREIKADLGGKKKGYVIITHAPVKEIR